jgi:hypothetical protein
LRFRCRMNRLGFFVGDFAKFRMLFVTSFGAQRFLLWWGNSFTCVFYIFCLIFRLLFKLRIIASNLLNNFLINHLFAGTFGNLENTRIKDCEAW